MGEYDTILQVKSYGAVRLKLKELMDERGISRNGLARSIGTRFEVVDKWYGGNVEKLDMDILARVCFVLGCGISDILEYQL